MFLQFFFSDLLRELAPPDIRHESARRPAPSLSTASKHRPQRIAQSQDISLRNRCTMAPGKLSLPPLSAPWPRLALRAESITPSHAPSLTAKAPSRIACACDMDTRQYPNLQHILSSHVPSNAARESCWLRSPPHPPSAHATAVSLHTRSAAQRPHIAASQSRAAYKPAAFFSASRARRSFSIASATAGVSVTPPTRL